MAEITETLREQLVRHEGLRLKMYKDSLGIETIGVGHNLRDVPISTRAAMVILDEDIENATNKLVAALPWVVKLDESRKNVLINMTFNMGINGLLQFKNTLKLIEDGKYEEASTNMLASKWALQVGSRAIELSNIMKSCS